SASADVFRQRCPALTARIESPGFVVVRFAERTIPRTPPLFPCLRPVDAPVRPFEQHALDLPDIFFRQPPVVIAEHTQIDHRVGLDAAGEVDVRVEIAERQRPRRREDGSSTVKTWVT